MAAGLVELPRPVAMPRPVTVSTPGSKSWYANTLHLGGSNGLGIPCGCISIEYVVWLHV